MLDILDKKQFFTIGELSKVTGVAVHSIRHWEQNFKLLTSARTKNGHRRYTKKDVEKLLVIKDLLYKNKMTLSGIKKHLSSKKSLGLNESGKGALINKDTLKSLTQIHKELSELLKYW